MYFLAGVCSSSLMTILYFIHRGLSLIQIIVPVGLIIWGSIDLGKAVIAGAEKEIQEAQKLLLRRVLAGVLVFFVVTFVSVAMSLVGNEDWKTCWNKSNDAANIDDLNTAR